MKDETTENKSQDIPILKHPWFLYAVIHIGIIGFILIILGIVMSTGITR